MENKNRLVLLDMLRAIGVMLMIEGHTIDAVLSPVYKDGSSAVFQFWTFFRGLTAPFFFFSAGLAFVVATVKYSGGFLSITGTAKKKRIRRIVTLLLIGYALHMPLQILYSPSSVPPESWRIFFVADALQIISLSLLVILVIAIVSRSHKTLLMSYASAAVLSLALAPVTEMVHWERFMHPALYPYLTFRAGSFFTFFPFSAFLFAGAAFGAAAIGLPLQTRARELTKISQKGAAVALVLSAGLYVIQMRYVSPYNDYWKSLPAVHLLRFGLVTMVASVVGYMSLHITRFPRILPAIGKSSLTIYIVHLMIVYGSPVNEGLSQLLVGGVHPVVAVLLAAGVMALMFAMVYTMESYRTRKRRAAEVTIGEVAK
ncbi:MAG: DUF1624 domain-containing protein [Bacteroidetes bacterium]|nr:DUF1624 domain-containing protein [Bacteroidota bacterium]